MRAGNFKTYADVVRSGLTYESECKQEEERWYLNKRRNDFLDLAEKIVNSEIAEEWYDKQDHGYDSAELIFEYFKEYLEDNDIKWKIA